VDWLLAWLFKLVFTLVAWFWPVVLLYELLMCVKEFLCIYYTKSQ